MSERIAYRKGYKYQIEESAVFWLQGDYSNIPEGVETDWLTLPRAGDLIIRKGYAWDGPSRPAIDTKTFMRGSLIHDALYQLIRLGYLDKATWKPRADAELRRICREDGMGWFRAWYIYQAVRFGGGKAASPAGIRPVLYAP